MIARLLALPITIALVAALSACASTQPQEPQSSTQGAVTRPATAVARHTRVTRRRRRRPGPAHSSPSRFAVSSASASVVQPQPAPGSCHARGSVRYTTPDPACTPGALDPAVTQATIGRTICVPGYTATIRPSDGITEPEKSSSMAAYGDGGATDDYEYDHLIPLELGGAVNDPRNLWPEPGGSPNPKDSVENALHDMVCAGEMPLARAQRIIAADWIR